ncbi:Exonuclease SbcC [Actinacidiphila bryophytorum]|uniref:Exonuclease SbcC n=1 Tax=Actinacidiphila bryophytorum TaxID=1436133 RepID=A0A9W4GYH8_9ACTN|nr:Exonuclease SbcC [Actinacidiphila bryophytorum]
MPLAVALLAFRPFGLGAQFPRPGGCPLPAGRAFPGLRGRAFLRGAGNCATSPHRTARCEPTARGSHLRTPPAGGKVSAQRKRHPRRKTAPQGLGRVLEVPPAPRRLARTLAALSESSG